MPVTCADAGESHDDANESEDSSDDDYPNAVPGECLQECCELRGDGATPEWLYELVPVGSSLLLLLGEYELEDALRPRC